VLVEQLRSLCASAETELLLVAPFIKDYVLRDLLQCIRSSVPVATVTRWSPQEIAAGVSDTEIWLQFRRHQHRRLFLRNDLHAKFYRSEGSCLIGSANLTGKALGLCLNPNLELLLDIPLTHPTVVQFEEALWKGAIEVNDEIYERTLEMVAALPPVPAEDVELSLPETSDPSDFACWTPKTRQPEDIVHAYCGQIDELSTTSAATAAMDLAVLRLPSGLDDPAKIRSAVALSLLQMPVFVALDDFLGDGERRFGEVAGFLSAIDENLDPQLVWQTMFRWLMYFQPSRYAYRRPRHSELIRLAERQLRSSHPAQAIADPDAPSTNTA
jgi:hypothetical protein